MIHKILSLTVIVGCTLAISNPLIGQTGNYDCRKSVRYSDDFFVTGVWGTIIRKYGKTYNGPEQIVLQPVAVSATPAKRTWYPAQFAPYNPVRPDSPSNFSWTLPQYEQNPSYK